MRTARVACLVREYDGAIECFTARLGFELVGDTALGDANRWDLVQPG
jgi:hypothetical protein